MRLLKQLIRRVYACVQERRWVRALMTRRFSSGKVALGEQNRYGVRPEWITVDLEDADINVNFRRHHPLPFPDHSQSIIYSAHVLEHVDDATVRYLLRECHRVLKPGGHLRVEVPDLEVVVEAYRRNDQVVLAPLCQEHQRTLVNARQFPAVYAEPHVALLGVASSYIDQETQVPVLTTKEEVEARLVSLSVEAFGRWCVSLQTPQQRESGGHVNPMSFDILSHLLREAGFREIARRHNGQTLIPHLQLNGLERPHRSFCSLYVEACK